MRLITIAVLAAIVTAALALSQLTSPGSVGIGYGDVIKLSPEIVNESGVKIDQIMLPSGRYDIGSRANFVSKERPIARFWYEGGAWCNVWADNDGIHYQPCSEAK